MHEDNLNKPPPENLRGTTRIELSLVRKRLADACPPTDKAGQILTGLE